METVIYSNSFSCKHNNSPFISRLTRPDSTRKPAPSGMSFPLLLQLGLSRFDSLSYSTNRSYLLSAKALDHCPENSFSFFEDSKNGSKSTPHFVNRVTRKFSQQHMFIEAGTGILLSTIFLTFLHSAIIPPAFATLQSAAKTGTALISSELLSSAWTGFFAGCLHTLSGPDHLAALAPLSIGRTRTESAAVGALWGCGHDAGQLLFGLIFLLLKDQLRIEVITTWGTRVVGFTLLVIGSMGIKEALQVQVPCTTTTGSGASNGKIGFATFATGIVHGLQPDALMMILPALALPSRLAGVAFLVMFLVGTVVAMGSYTMFIGSCSQALKERVPRITEKLTWASSIIAIALGLALLVSQYFGFSLY